MTVKIEARTLYYKGLTDELLVKEMQNFKLIVNRGEKPSKKISTLEAYYKIGMAECEQRGINPFDDVYLVEERRLLGEILESLTPELRSRLLVVSVLTWSERTTSAKYKIVFADGWIYQQGGGVKRKFHKSLTVSNEFAILNVLSSLKREDGTPTKTN